MSDIEKQQLIGMLIRKASYLREALTKIKNLHYVQAHQAKKIAIDALAKEAL